MREQPIVCHLPLTADEVAVVMKMCSGPLPSPIIDKLQRAMEGHAEREGEPIPPAFLDAGWPQPWPWD